MPEWIEIRSLDENVMDGMFAISTISVYFKKDYPIQGFFGAEFVLDDLVD